MKQHTALRPKGNIVVAGPDGTIEGDTLQCVHCGVHWVVRPGSGRRRGFCTKCGGPTCGRQGCEFCIPLEKKFEAIERNWIGPEILGQVTPQMLDRMGWTGLV